MEAGFDFCGSAWRFSDFTSAQFYVEGTIAKNFGYFGIFSKIIVLAKAAADHEFVRFLRSVAGECTEAKTAKNSTIGEF